MQIQHWCIDHMEPSFPKIPISGKKIGLTVYPKFVAALLVPTMPEAE